MEDNRRAWIKMLMWIGLAGAAMVLWYGTTARVRLVPPGEAPSAPDLILRDAEGITFDLEDYRGQVVVLNLWASWCGPCRDEIPALSRVARSLEGRGVAIIGVNSEELDSEALTSVGRELGISYLNAAPVTSMTGIFETQTIPTTWFIDRAGRVRGMKVGRLFERSLDQACETLLGEES